GGIEERRHPGLCPLDRARAAVVEALQTLPPRLHVDPVEIYLAHVCREEHVDRLRLADEGRPVSRVLHNPHLVQLKSGLENRFLLLVEEIQMLDGPVVEDDGRPGILVATTVRLENFPDMDFSLRKTRTASCECRRCRRAA